MIRLVGDFPDPRTRPGVRRARWNAQT
jgi:hypothetical protein